MNHMKVLPFYVVCSSERWLSLTLKDNHHVVPSDYLLVRATSQAAGIRRAVSSNVLSVELVLAMYCHGHP